MRRLTPVAMVLALITSVLFAVGALAGPAPVVSSACVYPTGTLSQAKSLAYNACRFDELAALHPVPTVTATVTETVTASPTPSPTPTPTPTPEPSPTPAPGGFPNASNTGVPAGTTLTAYTGSCTISAPATIDAKTITCDALLIRAPGVTITRSKIVGRVIIDTDIDRTWSLTLTDSEVDAGAGDLPAIYNGNATILRSNIHGGHNALECQEHSSTCVMRNSWVHDQWQAPTGDTHLGGILVLGNVVPCTGTLVAGVPACAEFAHNTVACDAAVNSSGGGCTGNINLLPHFGPLPGALIKDNLFVANVGSSFCTYGGAGMEHPADHIVYTGNVFQRGTNNQCAAYGPVTNFDAGAVGNAWSGNTWDDGTPLTP